MSDTVVLATSLQGDKVLASAWSSNPAKVSAKDLCNEIKKAFSRKSKGGFGGTDEQCQGAFYPDDPGLWECKKRSKAQMEHPVIEVVRQMTKAMV